MGGLKRSPVATRSQSQSSAEPPKPYNSGYNREETNVGRHHEKAHSSSRDANPRQVGDSHQIGNSSSVTDETIFNSPVQNDIEFAENFSSFEVESILNKSNVGLKEMTTIMRFILKAIVDLNRKLSNGIPKCNDSVEAMISEVGDLKKLAEFNNERINRLEVDFDDVQRQNRQYNVVISGLPVVKGIADRDLVFRISKLLDVNLSNHEIVSTSRIGNPSSEVNHPILVVYFNSLAARNAFFFSYIRSKEKPHLTDLNIGRLRTRIYINEHLSKNQANIFTFARSAKFKNKNIKRVTSRYGFVYVETISSNGLQRLSSTSQLDTLAPVLQHASENDKDISHEEGFK